jgi:hypothetical protein
MSIFNNPTALLNQLSDEELADLGIFLLKDGSVKGMPEFPFEVRDCEELTAPEYHWVESENKSPVCDKALDKSRINFDRPELYR